MSPLPRPTRLVLGYCSITVAHDPVGSGAGEVGPPHPHPSTPRGALTAGSVGRVTPLLEVPQPSVPATPAVPSEPATPVVPSEPVTPAVPDAPVVPADPDPGSPADPAEPADVPPPADG